MTERKINMNCPRCGAEMQGGVCPECGFPVTRWRRKTTESIVGRLFPTKQKRSAGGIKEAAGCGCGPEGICGSETLF